MPSRAPRLSSFSATKLPGDLVDEYRVQLQKFVSDPSDATSDAVTATLEAKAADMT